MKSFIALYGVTNIGKTTQLALIAERCRKEGKKIHIQKYPLYDLAPTGPLIHEALKGGNPKGLSAAALQALAAKNRFDFQPTLEELLSSPTRGVSAVAEMYTGTGIAYGLGDGVNKECLLALNHGLRVPDISILLDGERFMESVEQGHWFEEDVKKTAHIRNIHRELAAAEGWYLVNANQPPEAVHERIWCLLREYL